MTSDDARALLRMFLQDYDEENILLEFNEESEDEQLDFYIMMALGVINSVPPFMPNFVQTLDSFPMPQLLIKQAAYTCLTSIAVRQARNDITYNNSGISVKIHDAQRYNNSINIFKSDLQQEMEYWKMMKIAENMSACYGSSWSPYATLNGRRPV